MTISKRSWQRYIDALRKIDETAAERMDYYIQEFGLPQSQEDLEEFLYAAWNISDTYGQAAATLAAEMYDYTAQLQGAQIPDAEPAPTATYQEAAKAVQGALKSGNAEIVSSTVRRLTRQAGADTVLQNALRDGAQFAWIPSGDSCAFCITLSSRGWQYASKNAIKNGHAEHIHANCDCAYAVRFDGKSQVQGYDPDKYLALYNDADPGGTPTDKINAMRRDFYAENKERINSQKRAAYQKRKERNAPAAEELNVGEP